MSNEISPLAGPWQPAPGPGLRASHADRDAVVEVLRVAAGDGRLTAGELDERIEAALTARTRAELDVLTADLPAAGQQAGPAAGPARDLVTIDVHSGSAARDGAWELPKRMEVSVGSGSVKLDLTRAVITGPELEVDARVRSGSLTIVTRPGIVVDAGDVAIRSGSVKVRRHSQPAPRVLSVRVSGQVASGSLVARPPRRSFWQWLARRQGPWS